MSGATQGLEDLPYERACPFEPHRPQMSAIARVASGSAASWFRLAIGLATQLLMVPMFLSHWEPVEYGVWIGIAAVGSLIQFLDFGHHNYVGSEALRLGTRCRATTSRLYGSAIRVALIASVVELALVGGLIWVGVLGALLGDGVVAESLLGDAGLILILQSALWLLQGNWGSVAVRVLTPFGYFPQLVWFGVFVATVTTLAQALALTLGAGLLGVGIAHHCTFAVCSSLGLSYMRKAIARERLAESDSSYVLGIANYVRSVALSVKGALEMLRQEQFRLILAPLVGPAGLVLFMTSRTIANLLAAGLATITIPLTPELARYLNLRDAAKTASVMTVVWLVLVGVLAPGAVAASFFIEAVFAIWTRGQIPFDAVLFALFSIGVLLLAFSQPAIAVLHCLNRVKLQLTISGLTTAVAVAGTFIAAPVLGVRGAAGALLLAELILVDEHRRCSPKHVRVTRHAVAATTGGHHSRESHGVKSAPSLGIAGWCPRRSDSHGRNCGRCRWLGRAPRLLASQRPSRCDIISGADQTRLCVASERPSMKRAGQTKADAGDSGPSHVQSGSNREAPQAALRRWLQEQQASSEPTSRGTASPAECAWWASMISRAASKPTFPTALRLCGVHGTDAALVARLYEEHHFDYVYHLAAYAAEGLSHFIRRYNYTTNLIGSVNLINQAVSCDVKCFVFTSSIAVYGAGQTPMSEDSVPRPEDPYGISKYAVELDLIAAQQMFGLRYVIFRPHNVYGELQNIADRYRNVIGIFMNNLVQNKPLPIFGDGKQTRAFSHVDDVAPIIAMAPEVPGAHNQVFNVGADHPYSVVDLAHEIGRAFDVEPTLQHLPPRNEVVHAFSTHDKVRRVFRPGAPVSLRDGIARMALWVRERGPMTPVTFSNIEVRKNLPPSWDA